MNDELASRQRAISPRLAGRPVKHIRSAPGRSKTWFHKWWGCYLREDPEGLYDLTEPIITLSNASRPSWSGPQSSAISPGHRGLDGPPARLRAPDPGGLPARPGRSRDHRRAGRRPVTSQVGLGRLGRPSCPNVGTGRPRKECGSPECLPSPRNLTRGDAVAGY
jgi:hypothetical protein